MKTRTIILLPALAACAAPDAGLGEVQSALTYAPPPGLPASIAAGGRETIAPGSHLDDACPAGRWIGYLVIGPNVCPSPSSASWSRSKLFAGATPGSELDRYCAYQWNGFAPPNLGTLPPAVTATYRMRLERDCNVAARLTPKNPGVSFSTLFAPAFQAAFDAQAAMPSWHVPLQTPLSNVHVALIDTAGFEAFADNEGGRSNHAVSMANLIRRVACWDGQCALTQGLIAPYAGLPRAPWPRDAEEGGVYGSQTDVALAAFRALLDWRVGSRDTLHMVVNMSIGWDGMYGDESRVASRAVFDVLRETACEGAVIIAAAGNRSGDATEPMYPAAWESESVTCDGALRAPGTYDPLVHAVGAVDGRDRQLAIARADAIPRLVAPAAFLPGRQMPAPSVYASGVLSGSSIAAALTSGTAAAMWRIAPWLTPQALMSLLYAESVPLPGEQAHFGLENKPFGAVRRVSVCGAILAACARAGASCNLGCVERPAGSDATVSWSVVSGVYADPVPEPPVTHRETAPSEYADEALSEEIDPWAHGQPGKSGCPLCYLTPTNVVYGEIQLGDGEALRSVEVEVFLDDGTSRRFKQNPPALNLYMKLEPLAPRVVQRGAVYVYTFSGGNILRSASELLLPSP